MRFHRSRRRTAGVVLAGIVASAWLAPVADAEATGTWMSTSTKPPVVVVETGGGPGTPAVNPVTNKVYVPNATSNTLSVIDGATHKVTSVETGPIPRLVLVNSRTNDVFVLTSEGLDVIDGGSNIVTRRVPELTGRMAAINEATGKVYVVPITRSARIYEYDSRADSLSSVPLGERPADIAINEVTNTIYLANATDNTVTVVDGDTRRWRKVKVGEYPVALAVNSETDRVYVANLGKRPDRPPVGNFLTVIEGGSNATSRIQVDLAPVDLAVDSSRNRVYVLSQTTFALTVVDGARKRAVGSVTTVGVGGIGIDQRTNRVYVSAAPFLTIVDAATLTKVRVDAGGRMASAAVVNPANGKTYVNNPASGSVAVIG